MSFDKTRLVPCPVLTPSPTEFEDPMAYLSRPDVAKLGAEYGLIKVVPPTGWQPPFLLSPSFRFHTRLQRLSDLGITTRSRAFFRRNINRFLKMRNRRTLRLFFSVAKDIHGQRRRIYYYDLYAAVDRAGGYDRVDWAALNAEFGVPPRNRQLQEEYNVNIKAYAVFLASTTFQKFVCKDANEPVTKRTARMASPDQDVDDDLLVKRAPRLSGDENCKVCGLNDRPEETLLCDNCDQAYHMRCLNPQLEKVPATSWFCDTCLIGTGEYGFQEDVDLKYTLPEFYQLCREFDQEFADQYNNGEQLTIDKIEAKFWDFVDREKSDLEVKYGADIHNLTPGEISGFPMANTPALATHQGALQYEQHPFNLTKLPFARGLLMEHINTSISGMTVPWIYIGSLLLTFCWHVEDHYTLSINYCHFGATKKWYGIPSLQALQFEELMKKSAPDLFQRQPDLLHQLVTLLSPMTLVDKGIRCVYADQNPNEFVITYPKVYHSGFNCGFNFNEAVNFTIEPWLEFGEQAIVDYKEIQKENVFNHYQLIENILRSYLGGQSQFTAAFLDRCISSFELFQGSQAHTISQLPKGLYIVEYQQRERKARDVTDEQNGLFRDEDTNEPEMLCDGCKTHLAYQYFKVPNEEQQFTLRRRLKDETAAQAATKWVLPTPKQSPHDRSFKEKGALDKVPDSASSRRMSLLTSDPASPAKKLSEEEEFQQLINAAKRARSEAVAKAEAASSSKRRRSTRIQKKEEIEIASLGCAKTLRTIHEKLQLMLCVECIEVYNGELPRGTTLVYDTLPQDSAQLVRDAENRLNAARATAV